MKQMTKMKLSSQVQAKRLERQSERKQKRHKNITLSREFRHARSVSRRLYMMSVM